MLMIILFFFFNDTATTEIYTLSLHDALPICKTGVEEAGVTEKRTSLSEKKFELWREIKVWSMIKLLSRQPTTLLLRNPSATNSKTYTPPHIKPRTRKKPPQSQTNRNFATYD